VRNPAAGENRGVDKDALPVCANFWKIRKETTLNSLSKPETVGLLAGWGQFPVEFAKKAKALGIPVITVGLRDSASESLCELSAAFYWSSPTRLGTMIRAFKRHGVKTIVMAGKVHKHRIMHQPWKLITLFPDWTTIRFWYGRRIDNKDDTILLGIIRVFEREGIKVGSALDLCPELLVTEGILTRRKPSTAELLDIDFGWALAMEMGRLDVGQSVMVKDRSVLAVEAVEGTDQAIMRAGSLCRSGGFTVVKVAKPQQDMRFDVPTIGVNTVENIHKAGGKVIAVEAGKTILLDPEGTLAKADKLGVTIVARASHSSAS
jgi:hypothetical protein